MEELYYEFRDHVERDRSIEVNAEQETDKIEQEKQDDALAWAEAEEQKELDELEAKEKDWKPSDVDKAWMEEQTRKALEEELKIGKEQFGEGFGEDISEDFDG